MSKPLLRVTEAAFDAHVAEWPRPLRVQIWEAHEPPIVCLCDDTRSSTWPENVVAAFYYDNYESLPDRGWMMVST